MQAAIGVAQLKKLDCFVEKRRNNWAYLREKLTPLEQYLWLSEQEEATQPSWFGFLLTMREGNPISWDTLVSYLEKHNIQTRPLFAGNLLRHPCFQALEEGRDYRIAVSLTVTDQVMNHSFWVSVYPRMVPPMLEEMVARLLEAGEAGNV